MLDNNQSTGSVPTDRSGRVCFDIPVSILVEGVERYQGRLDGEVAIELWNPTETGNNLKAQRQILSRVITLIPI
ncbi:MAG: hypothetical protein RQ982_04375 [Gammaproteobacteria bacterium]|nr:hypothetical protein [Gammaproteobacteria bacterium]